MCSKCFLVLMLYRTNMVQLLLYTSKQQYIDLIRQCVMVTLFALLMQSSTQAQRNSFHTAFDRITTQQGLPHNNVLRAIQDSYGFMWFATKNSLCRYDGYDFVLFQHSADTTRTYLSDNNIMDVCLDSSKYLWVGTLSGGVNRIHTGTGKTTVFSKKYSQSKGINDNKVTSIICDTEGTVWVGTWSGLSKFDATSQTFTNYALPSADKPNHVFAIYADDKGVIWVSTEVAIYHFNTYTEAWSLWQPLTTVYTFSKDREGYLWMGGSFGLKRYNFQTTELLSLNDSINSHLPVGDRVSVNDIETDRQGYLWVGTSNHGIFRCRSFGTQKKWDWITNIDNQQNSLSHNNIRTLYCDKDGILWVATRGGGVNKHYPFESMFHYYQSRPNKKILFDLFTSLQIGEDKKPVIGARNGIFTINKQDSYLDIFDKYTGKQLLNQLQILGIFFDNSNRLWVATRNGCYLVDKSVKKAKAFFYSKSKDPQSIITKRDFDFLWADTLAPTMQIASMVQDKQGDFWFGTRGGGIYRIDSTYRRMKIYRYNNNRIDENRDLINVLFKDRNENIWAGTDDGLLMLDRQQDTFRVFLHQPQIENSLSNNRVQTIYEDSKGLLWIGTYNGLNVLNVHAGQWQRLYSSHGLSSNIINSIVGESPASDVLWIGTEFGLTRVAPLDSHSEKNILPIQFTFSRFGIQNGLLYPEFIPNGACRGDDGLLYFAQYSGILQINSRAFVQSRNYLPPSIALTAFKKFGKPIGGDIFYSDEQPIEVEEKDNVITFEFVALNYYYSSSNQYSYFLEGFDRDWSEPSNQRQVTYTNLSPGTYTFKIKASNNDGVWNPQVKKFLFIVHPPWWKTQWSYFAYSFFSIICLVFFIRYRERVQRKNLTAKYQKREADIIFQKNQILEEANNRLVSLNAELQEINGQLHEVNEEKTDIVNLVVHDLKNPVIGIQKLAYSLEALGRRSAQEQIAQSGAVIKHTAERMYSLIQQLLRVHAVEHDKNTISCIPLDIQEITEQYIEELIGRQQQIRIRTEYKTSGPYIAYADPLAFLQILENLISNATKVSAVNGEILVSIEHRSPMLVLSVEDFGSGIEKEQQDRMFKKYSSVGRNTFDSSSNGLGLYIVKKLVEAMNGSLSFETVLGQGTVFKVFLPTTVSE